MTDGRSMAEERERGETRAGSTIQARTSRRGGRRPVATRTPRTIGTRAAQVRGCTSQCFVSLILHGRQRPKRCRNATSKRRTRGVEMGCAPSQPKQKPPSPQKRDFREQLVWERSGRKFCEVYELLKDLNSGSFGTVALCRRKADGNRSIERTPSRNNLQRVKSESVFAMKALDYMRHNGRLRLDEATRKELRHEIDVLRKVDHPSIVHLREAFWEPTRLVLVMEYCEGRELAEFCGRFNTKRRDSELLCRTFDCFLGRLTCSGPFFLELTDRHHSRDTFAVPPDHDRHFFADFSACHDTR